MSKIFIDPGHGGHDPGAVGKQSKEKDNVLKVGLRLKTLLESAGHTVKMSRSTDVFIGLSERARMADAWGADYFISLHDNSATSYASGFETFIYNGPVSDTTTKLQSVIHKAIASKIGIRDRGQKRGNLAVLRESAMPAVLIEYAFISNGSDESILINKVEQLAQWTAEGITAYAGGSVEPAAKLTTPKEEEFLMLNSRESEEMAKAYELARKKGVFSSDQHEKDVRAGEMAPNRAIHLATVIAGASLNGGKRIE
ncbi:N-acetylmuramoyl-L-alanine amidase family protein [Sporosarcina sp. SAFN-010]|uniref:N-acetylmuramoyl-L-alanine amidase family protein n=1 Tax=Sporosarcina sp. SAFN-010 TaxID=3387273 RepID=UPI003F80B4E5